MSKSLSDNASRGYCRSYRVKSLITHQRGTFLHLFTLNLFKCIMLEFYDIFLSHLTFRCELYRIAQVMPTRSDPVFVPSALQEASQAG